MATVVIDNAYVQVGSADLSPYLSSISLEFTVDTPEDTAFGDEYRSRVVGLKDVSLSVDFMQDFDASAFDATVWPMFATSQTVTIRSDSAAASATNPQYSGAAIINSYPVLSGSVGDVASGTLGFQPTGTWTRTT